LTAVLPSRGWAQRIASGLLFGAILIFSGWSIGAYFIVWGVGVIAALLPLRMSSSMRAASLTLALPLFFAVMYLELKFHVNRFVGDLMLSGVFLLILWIVLHERQFKVSDFYRRPAQRLSAMSYTLYVVHIPVLYFISAILFPVWAPLAFSVKSVLEVILIDGFVLAAAWVMYVAFERNTSRVRRTVDRFIPGKQSKPDRKAAYSATTG
jgi:peptidoglycan/LPS O-acetylase OafA/YrhL